MVIKNRKLLKKQIQKEFLEAKISDNFIFTKVFQKEELLRELIRRILPEVRLGKIKILAREYDVKEIEKGKGIVLDIYVEDEDKMIDIEMQVVNKPKELPHRVRYYHELMDVHHLDEGENYGVMKDSYVVFIC
ncbi:MAG: Rpn family recombination-promoting nuclease/putative transposase, partial [Solobacterium sp.]|nr:Rpn family recombination-promoting nuclease/putative transposase [Solobacterium sp.]